MYNRIVLSILLPIMGVSYLFVAGCPTFPDPAILQIEAEAPRNDEQVFSPAIGDELTITQQVAQDIPDATEWIGNFYNEAGDLVFQREWSGTMPPSSFLWDGMNEAGGQLPDGIYRYQLLVRFGDTEMSMDIDPIEIDSTSPTIDDHTIVFPTRILQDAAPNSVSFGFSTEDRNPGEWAVTISTETGVGPTDLYSGGNELAASPTLSTQSIDWGTIESVGREGLCTEEIVSMSPQMILSIETGEDDTRPVTPDQTYQYVLEITDIAGNRNSATDSIFTPLLVICDVTAERCRIGIGSILFEGGTAVFSGEQDKDELFAALSTTLQKYREDYHLTLTGHTNSLVRLGTTVLSSEYLNTPPATDDPNQWQCRPNKSEQEMTLIKLSEDRIKAVRDVLIDYGIDPDSIHRMVGRGGEEPLVPHNWKAPFNPQDRSVNRRVEFQLERK